MSLAMFLAILLTAEPPSLATPSASTTGKSRFQPNLNINYTSWTIFPRAPRPRPLSRLGTCV